MTKILITILLFIIQISTVYADPYADQIQILDVGGKYSSDEVEGALQELTTNATHTGEVTGSGALTVNPVAISNKADTTIADGDYLLFFDISDNLLKKVDAAELTTASGGDISSVGDALSGAAFDGTADGGTWLKIYDGDSNFTQLKASDTAADPVITLPAVTGTLIYSGGAFHDGFSDFVANEHLDWTLSSVGTIHATNYVDNDTTYLGGDAITLVGTTFNFDGGATPAGELGGTWANPTIDSVHSGSAHHSAVTVTDTATIDMTLVGQDVKADLKADSVDSEHYIDDSIDDVHLNLGTGANQVGANDIEFQAIGSPTYSNAQHWFDIVQSSGIIDGYTITSGDDATHIDIAAGKGIIKTTDSELGTTVSFETSAVDELELTALSMNYIYVDYSAGSPQVLATTDYSTIELNRMFPIGLVYSNVAVTHIANVGVHISNLARTEHERLAERDGFTYISGAATTKSTLDLIITPGVWYYGHTRITTDALDTTGADTFIYIHYGTASWITDNATASAVDATHYNDGDDVLGELGVNAYGTQWLYVTTDSHYYIKYGTQNGTLSAAELANPPAEGHIYLDGLGKLIAKIIVRQTGDIVAITQIFEDTYISGTVANHQELGELQGGTAAEYYHLTSSEHTELSAWLDDVTLGSSGSLTLPSGQTFAINAADISEEELEILDGATLITTQINYLNSVTGTTGTTSSNLVFSTSPTIDISLTGSYLTASEILITDADKKIVSAPVATYPSLTELSYVKGLTGALQTLLDARCLESVFGTSIGTGLTLDGTALKTHVALQSISGLTETNGGILYGTADNTYAWLAAGATTEILVGGGAAAPIWTTATGTGAPVRATAPIILLDSIPDADDTWNGITINSTAGENLVKNDVVYLKSDGKYWKADGDTEALTKGKLALATATINADASGVLLTEGYMRDDGDFNYTVGATLYISLTPGDPTETIPPDAGDFVRVVGTAESADVIHFKPSADYLERN
ncbi:MAG: hypothetical protein KAQ99_08685 [Candidatus Aureabacteria bacterium]|nr:hypothetical protein [Candidatus Auribacterota bacterium]